MFINYATIIWSICICYCPYYSKLYVSLQWYSQQIESLIKVITPCLQASPPKARISQLKSTPVLFVGFVFVTCVITCSPAEYRFVRGEEPPVRPLTGLPDFILLLQMFQAVLCHLVTRSFLQQRGRNTADTHIRRTWGGGRWVIWWRARPSTSSSGINSSRRLLLKLFN